MYVKIKGFGINYTVEGPATGIPVVRTNDPHGPDHWQGPGCPGARPCRLDQPQHDRAEPALNAKEGQAMTHALGCARGHARSPLAPR